MDFAKKEVIMTDITTPDIFRRDIDCLIVKKIQEQLD